MSTTDSDQVFHPSDLEVFASVVTEYGASKAAVLFRATWDYLPEAILKLFRFIPAQPFTFFRHLKTLYAQYGEQILRENRSQIEKRRGNKDIMSLLSTSVQLSRPFKYS